MSSYPAALRTYLETHGPRISKPIRRALLSITPADVGLDQGHVTDRELEELRRALERMRADKARRALTHCTGLRKCASVCSSSRTDARCESA